MNTLLLVLLAALPAQPIGKCVLDETNTLTSAQVGFLETVCEKVDKAGDGQIEVVVTNDFRGDEKEEFTNKLFNNWAIGHKGRNDGVLVVLSPQMRKWRIEVGYGLEGRITDADAARIGREYGVPEWKAGRWYNGLSAVVSQIAPMMHAEAVAVGPVVKPAGKLGWDFFIFVLSFLGLAGLFIWWLSRINKPEPKRVVVKYDPPPVTRYAPIAKPVAHTTPRPATSTTTVVVVESEKPKRRDDTPPSYSSSSSYDSGSSWGGSDSGGGFGGGDGGMSGGGGAGGDF